MKKKLLYLVNVDWFFNSHRYDLALAAARSGFDVHICCNVTSEILTKKFASSGLTIHRIRSPRGKHGFYSTLEHIIKYLLIIHRLKPSTVHLITIKPIILGGLICRFFNTHCIASITGLGPAFDERRGLKIKKRLFQLLLTKALNGIDHIIVQNKGDLKFINTLQQTNHLISTTLIKGSGVPLQHYKPKDKRQTNPFVVVSSGRLLKQKGFIELVAACKSLRERGLKFQLKIYGWRDSGNSDCIEEKTIKSWLSEGLVDSIEKVDDMCPALGNSSLFVLASYYGEGLPRAIIEAQACGLPVITTSIPGCIDSILNDVTGEVVPPRDPNALAKSIASFITNHEKTERFGIAARTYALNQYSIDTVIKQHLLIYGAYKPETKFN